MSSCNSSGDSTIHDEDEEEGAALLTESVVVTVDAVTETAATTTSTSTAATGGGSLSIVESLRTHISRSQCWRRILSPLILLVVVGILAIAIISSHAPKNVNHYAGDTSDNNGDVLPVESGIEEPFIDPFVVSPSEKQQQKQQQHTRDPKIVPQWQSIIPDTGFMYPLMGGNNRKHQWKLHSTDEDYRNISVKGEPGDIITDLMNAGIMEEPYFDLNFLKQRHIWRGNNSTDLDTPIATFTNPRKPKLEKRKRIWVYETEFELPPEMQDHNSTTKVLVLEGIKMGARVKWNNIEIGVATDQFLRYTYTVTNTMLSLYDKHNKHKLSITFDPTINTDGRFAGYSGGWDWAAYMPVGDERGSRVWTFGIHKHMYIVAVEHAYISHVVPKIYYQGKHPTQPMLDGPEADFYVQVDVHVVFPSRDCDFNDKNNDHLFLEVTSNFTSSGVIKKFVPKMMKTEEESTIVSSLNMTVSKDDIELWWPNGMGHQRLYPLQVRLIRQQREGGGKDVAPTSSSPTIEKRIGFRTAALVTVDDTIEEATLNQTLAAVGDGSGNHGMYFRVNGAMVWARGGNMIPMDQLEGRLSDEAHRELVQSTAAAHMNMLRVWGGGMVLPDSFYNACDEEGILLYHDMLFVLEHQHDALQDRTVAAELKHTIRSLASHPSIVLWSGCNECDNLNIFASYVMRIVADEDDTRAIWPNSPSKSGWGSGVNTLDGLPNGEKLTIGSGSDAATSLEGHGPYQHSFSRTHPTVNSVFANKGTNIPAMLSTEPIGPMYQNRFSSEFGSSVMSSFESMSGTLSPSEWNIHGSAPPATCERIVGHDLECVGQNVWSQRNYACDSHIEKYFGSIPFEEEFGRGPLQAQLFNCMMGQALWMKGYFESLRSQNSFGALMWQLNENWPTGGWGAIEYGTLSVKGQVIGGRWKPLMHMFQNTLLCDVFAACGKNNTCLIRNDGMHSIDVRANLEYWVLSQPRPIHYLTHPATLEGIGGKATADFFVLESSPEFARAEVILIWVEDQDGTILMRDNAFLKETPKSIPGLEAQNVTISVSVSRSDSDRAVIVISLESDFLALYVTLTTMAQGRFSENSFHLRPNVEKVIEFIPPHSGPPVNTRELETTLRVEHLGSYLSG